MTDTKNDSALLPELAHAPGFAPQSRVWVYVCDRRLNDAEATYVQTQLSAFAKQWTAHDQALKAAAEVYDNQILILMVDETQAGASGCSIDKSVHFLEALGAQMNADFFDRLRFGWIDENGVSMANQAAFRQLVQTGHIKPETPVINTLVQTKSELEAKWLLPFATSWHKRLV